MKKLILYMTLIFSFSTCVVPFEFERRDAENILVVEATLTDKVERQQVFLKRTSNLEEVNLPPEGYNPNVPPKTIVDLTNYEKNASVTIFDDMGNEYDFIESEPGTYISEMFFAAEPEREYQLKIFTSINENVTSEFMALKGKSKINAVYAERIINDQGVEGMAIYVDGEDSNGSTDYFRYVYEETYKIIAPKWKPFEFNVVYEGNLTTEFPIIEIVPRAQEERVCYGRNNSADILLSNTTNLEFPEVKRNLVRFIDRDNPILSHRYSILVRQFLLSPAGFQYYNRLRSFSKNENVFNDIQPGLLEGNLKPSTENASVIGYFDVASVSQERIFFDYENFFQGQDLPPYFFGFDCSRVFSPPLLRTAHCPQPLTEQIGWGIIEFLEFNDGTLDGLATCPGPYIVTPRICGDCTILGSNIKPDFWIE